MSKRVSNIYYSLDGEGNFRFPEQDELDINPNKLAIAISGGGTRSMVASIGHFRAFKRKNQEFHKDISYISGVSGGSWFATIFTLARVDMNSLLGESIKINDISRLTLNTTNFYNKDYMGNMLSNFPIVDKLSNGYLTGVLPSKLWNYAVSSVILDPYDLDNLYLVNSKKEAKLNSEFNNINCIYPKSGYPFLISVAATVDERIPLGDENTGLFEFTPMYSGMRVPSTEYGGILFSNPAFGCNFKNLNSATDKLEVLTVNKNRNAKIEISVSASSAALGIEAIRLTNSMMPFSGYMSRTKITTNVWGFASKQGRELNLVDGTFLDYSGVVSLAARGCKKIISFLNTESFHGNYCNFGITQLFGVDDEFQCDYHKFKDKNRIFSLENWIQMRKDFEKRIEDGKIPFFHRKMDVLPNWRIGVNGGYETEVLFVPLLKYNKFFEQLPIDVNSDKFSELKNVPNIDLIFSKEGFPLELTNSQVNLISTYTDWYLTQIMDELPEFFA